MKETVWDETNIIEHDGVRLEKPMSNSGLILWPVVDDVKETLKNLQTTVLKNQ